jgi:hypothetical protein
MISKNICFYYHAPHYLKNMIPVINKLKINGATISIIKFANTSIDNELLNFQPDLIISATTKFFKIIKNIRKIPYIGTTMHDQICLSSDNIIKSILDFLSLMVSKIVTIVIYIIVPI